MFDKKFFSYPSTKIENRLFKIFNMGLCPISAKRHIGLRKKKFFYGVKQYLFKKRKF